MKHAKGKSALPLFLDQFVFTCIPLKKKNEWNKKVFTKALTVVHVKDPQIAGGGGGGDK